MTKRPAAEAAGRLCIVVVWAVVYGQPSPNAARNAVMSRKLKVPLLSKSAAGSAFE